MPEVGGPQAEITKTTTHGNINKQDIRRRAKRAYKLNPCFCKGACQQMGVTASAVEN